MDGDACAKPQNLIVPVGTAYEDVLNAAGVKGGVKLGKVVAGGAMMGPAVENAVRDLAAQALLDQSWARWSPAVP